VPPIDLHLDFEIVKRHQEFCPECAVVNVACAKEEGAQKLQRHVVPENKVMYVPEK
jgi:hypothetical protein